MKTTSRNHVISIIAIFIPVLLLSIWSGGVFAFSIYIAAGFLCLASAVSIIKIHTTTEHNNKTNITIPTLCWITIILFLAISAMPLPGKMDALTGSKRYEQNNTVRTFLSEAKKAGTVENNTAHFSISRNRSGTLRILLLAVSMLGTSILSASLPVPFKKKYIGLLAVFFTLLSAAGFIHQWILPEEKTIWWLFNVEHGRPVGGFINRTHYAGFIAMGCPINLVLFLNSLTRKKWGPAALCGIAFLITGFAVSASLSRGALLACAVSLIIITFLILFKGRLIVSIPLCLSACLLVCCIAIGIAKIPNDELKNTIITRIETLRDPLKTDSAKSRLAVWRAATKIWRDYPILGVGANGFRMLFPQYRTKTDRKPFSHTENEYVELLTDTGLLGTLMTCALVIAIFARWRSNIRELLPSEISLAVGGATIVVAIHNAMDFPMHEPLYAIVYSSIIGLVLSQPAPAMTQNRHLSGLSIQSGIIATVLSACGFLILLSLAIFRTTQYKLDSPAFIEQANEKELVSALSASPTSWYTWALFGTHIYKKGTDNAILLGEKCLARAAEYDPNNYLLWETVGNTRLRMGDEEGAKNAFARMTKLREWKKGKQINKDKY